MTDAQKFVVVASPRTGSNYLQSLLSSHPKVFCAGETFLQPQRVIDELRDIQAPVEKLGQLGKSLKGGKSVAALETFYSMAPCVNAEALGFRLFYDHLGYVRNQAVMRYLRANDVKIVHLQRENLLRQFLSLTMAEEAGIWVSSKKVPSKTVHLDARKCRRYLQRAVRTRNAFSRKLRHLTVLGLTYEQLSEDYQKSMEEIWQFLGVESAPVSSTLKKLNNAPLHEAIQNYSELKRSLAETPWNKFFDDE